MENRKWPIFKWKRIEQTEGLSPRPRHGHRAIAIRDLMVIFGGGNEGIFDGLHVFDTATNHWYVPKEGGDLSPGRAAFGLVVDNTRIICFGGMVEFGQYSSDIFELQASRWEWKQLYPQNHPHQPVPCARIGHTFNLLGKKVYLFGGLAKNPIETQPRYLNDLFILDLKENGTVAWELPKINGAIPPPRESHSAVIYSDRYGREKLIIYGGMNGNRLGDLWTLHLSTMHWTKELVCGKVPLPRSLHTATVMSHRMFVFGGWVPLISDVKSQENFFVNEREWKCSSELACLNLETMVWEELQIEAPEENLPKARAGHSALAMDSRIYFWSGRDGYNKAWNNQVCCKDIWYLEVHRPPVISRIQLISSSINFLEVNWPKTTGATQYILQIMKYEPQQADKFPEIPLPHPQNIPPNLPIPVTNPMSPCARSPNVTGLPRMSPCVRPPNATGLMPMSPRARPPNATGLTPMSPCARPPNATGLPPMSPCVRPPNSTSLLQNKSKLPVSQLPLPKPNPPVKSLIPVPALPPNVPNRSPQHMSPAVSLSPVPKMPPNAPSLAKTAGSPQYIPYSVNNSSQNSVVPSANAVPSTLSSQLPSTPTTTAADPIIITIPPSPPKQETAVQHVAPAAVPPSAIPRPVHSTKTVPSHIPVACAPVAPRHQGTPTRALLSTKLHSYSIPASSVQNVRLKNQPLTLWPLKMNVSEPSVAAVTDGASGVTVRPPAPATVAFAGAVNPTATTVTPPTAATSQPTAAVNQSPGINTPTIVNAMLNARPVTIITPSNFAKTFSAGKPLRFNVQKFPGSTGKNPCVFVQKAPGVIVAKENIPKLTLSQGGQQKTIYKIVNTSQGTTMIPPGTRVITIKRPPSIKVPDTVRTVPLEAHRVPQPIPTANVTASNAGLPTVSVEDGAKPSTSQSSLATEESSPTEELIPETEINEGHPSQQEKTLKRSIDGTKDDNQEESPILGKLLRMS